MRIKKWLNKNKAFFLFCEWESEVCYFSQLKIEKWYNIPIIKQEWQIPKTKSKLNALRKRLYLISWYTKNDLKETNSKIFFIADIDHSKNNNDYKQSDIKFIEQHLQDENIIVIWSNTDFELWILLHFTLYKKENNNYINKINKLSWTKYKKWDWLLCIKFYREIIEKYLDIACKNAKELKKLNIYQWKIDLKDKLPYTEIYKIIEAFIK